MNLLKFNKIIKKNFTTTKNLFEFDPFDSVSIYKAKNLVQGKWSNDTDKKLDIIDPLNGKKMIELPLISTINEKSEIIDSINNCPKSGLHNPLKNPERYQMFGDIFFRTAEYLRNPEFENYFIKAIQRVMPKSYNQIKGEVVVTRKFLENFTGDCSRFFLRSFQVAGDHNGQYSSGHRWPYGPVSCITPFNFPFEIPVLQFSGALLSGNKVLLKCDERVSVVMEMYLRLLHECGLPKTDLDFINCKGDTMESILTNSKTRLVQFTGSSAVAEKVSSYMNGRVRIEDAGYDWKILGPDVVEMEHVVYQCDQDAYAATGQKCSATSILFMHKNWRKENFLENLEKRVKTRKLDNLTIGPILTWNNEKLKNHISELLKIKGSKILFGGKELKNHNIPEIYGSFEPTAVFIPFREINKKENFDLVTTEVFAPFQIITEYDNSEINELIDILENVKFNLTAGIASNDIRFVNKILANTCNGVTYAGILARTTGAPQNHWFGPCGDPRGSGIGTPEGISLTWTSHREIVYDFGPSPLKKIPGTS